MIPFSVEQFLDVFGRYNSDLPNVAIAASAAALLAVAVAFGRDPRFRIVPGLVLVFLWFWSGTIYQICYFAPVNPLAYFFGSLFVLEAALLLYFGVFRAELAFEFRADAAGFAGAAIILYALVLYPLLGYVFGHAYPRTPTFGVPCPATIFTFGLLLWSKEQVKWRLLAIPILWSFIGSSATFLFGIWQDAAMPLAAAAILYFNHKKAVRKLV